MGVTCGGAIIRPRCPPKPRERPCAWKFRTGIREMIRPSFEVVPGITASFLSHCSTVAGAIATPCDHKTSPAPPP